MTFSRILNLVTPPLVAKGYHALTRRRPPLHLSGNYQSWEEAAAASMGYDSESIIAKTMQSLLQVKSGQAVYERDSVLFDRIQYSWPLLAALMWAAGQSNGQLNVLDFGGSLGSTYYQNRAFIQDLPGVRWNIVEQPRYVEVGRAHFEDRALKFYRNIEECLADSAPNVVLLCSVLQYLPKPFDILNRLLDLQCRCLVIDRTPFWTGSTDWLSVQYTSPDIYTASYPSWIFSWDRFLSCLKTKGDVVADYSNPDMLPGPIDFSYRGMVIRCGPSQ